MNSVCNGMIVRYVNPDSSLHNMIGQIVYTGAVCSVVVNLKNTYEFPNDTLKPFYFESLLA